MTLLLRLLHGRHHQLFTHGFPLTARLAWGCRLRGDPELSAWLVDKELFERRGNGVVLFAPSLLARAKHDERAPLERLKGILRWRHARNVCAYDETSTAVEALLGLGSVLVAGGWSDVASGRATLSAAHLTHTFVALKRYDRDAVAHLLTPLGWRLADREWRRDTPLGGKGKMSVRLHVAPDLGPVAWPPGAENERELHHASGPHLTLLLAERAIDNALSPVRANLIDRMVQDLSSRQQLQELRQLANQLRCRKTFDKVFGLVERICRGKFESVLPEYPEERP